MSKQEEIDRYMVKEEHSEVFTLRSIDSSEEMLEFIPVYYRHSENGECKSGHWSAKEHIKYVMFLDYFAHIFIVKHNIKLWKIFTIMSTFIKTRNSSQCRSHHQKTERKYNSIEEILKIEKTKYRNYENQFERMKESLAKLPIHNPLEVEIKQESIDPIPSLKILEEEIQYPIMRNSISLVDMHEMEKSEKSCKIIGSEKILHYPREKYIASEVSIEMEHENDELSQERIKEIMYEELEVDYEKEKEFWLFPNSQGDNSEKKDEKFDRTADTIFNDANNKTFSEEKPKHDSLPEKKSANQEQDEIPTGETLKTSTNLVRKKRSRTRSLLPSYDIVENEGKASPSQFYKESRKDQLYTPEGKCKTLPPRSVKDENEESETIEKEEHKEPVLKSFFSGFVSSMESHHNGINQYEHDSQELESQNNLYEDDSEKNDYFQLKVEEFNNENDSLGEPQQENIFYCDYGMKGNLYNEISADLEESFNFVPQKMLKGKQKSEDYGEVKYEQSKMNFTKKSTQEIEKARESKIDRSVEYCEENNKEGSNFEQEPFLQNNSLQYHQPYIQSEQLQAECNNYPMFYDPYLFSQHQYPLIPHTHQQFMEFYIYFLIQKIQMASFFYNPNN